MDNLFEFDEDYNIVISPQALALKAFRDVVKKHKDPELGIIELNYIAFLLHPKSDFNDIRDEDERSQEIRNSMYRGKEFKITKITKAAIEFYKLRNQTTKTIYLDANKDALDKTSDYLNEVDFSARDSKGALLYKPKEVIDVIKEAPKLMTAIRDLEEQIRKDQEVENSVRGSGKKGIYEDD